MYQGRDFRGHPYIIRTQASCADFNNYAENKIGIPISTTDERNRRFNEESYSGGQN